MQWNVHDREGYIQRIHLLDDSLPIFHFDGGLPVGNQHNLASPSFLLCKEYILGLDTDDESVERWSVSSSNKALKLAWTYDLRPLSTAAMYQAW